MGPTSPTRNTTGVRTRVARKCGSTPSTRRQTAIAAWTAASLARLLPTSRVQSQAVGERVIRSSQAARRERRASMRKRSAGVA